MIRWKDAFTPTTDKLRDCDPRWEESGDGWVHSCGAILRLTEGGSVLTAPPKWFLGYVFDYYSIQRAISLFEKWK